MSAIHEQAMTYVYQQVLQRLLDFYSRAERTALQLLIQRLIVAAGGIDRIADYRVLTIQNGTREGFYVLTALRAAQLSIAGRYPATFALRVATPRHGETTQASLENIHRCFSALFLYDDPRAELLMADHREVVPFSHTKPVSAEALEANRMNLIVLGHLRSADSLLGLGDEGYLSMADFYRHLARWEAGVDSWVSIDTPRQQKQFMAGFQRASRKIGQPVDPGCGFDSLFAQIDTLGGDLLRRFYGDDCLGPWQPEGRYEACRRVGHISIYDLVTDRLEQNNWPLFSEFLRVRPEGLTAPTLEHEYLSPFLSAHLYGLHACYVQGRSYEAGYSDYVQRAIMMMHRKQLPVDICQQAQELFGTTANIPERRALAAIEAQSTLGLNETQLVCMLFAPFAEQGAGLEHFLRCRHPGMLVALPDLHKAMQGGPVADQVGQWMVEVSGLPIAMIVKLYQRPITPAQQGAGSTGYLQSVAGSVETDEGGQGADDLCERSVQR